MYRLPNKCVPPYCRWRISTNWKTEADGKLLIDALYERYSMRIDKLTFKKRVVRAMRQIVSRGVV